MRVCCRPTCTCERAYVLVGGGWLWVWQLCTATARVFALSRASITALGLGLAARLDSRKMEMIHICLARWLISKGVDPLYLCNHIFMSSCIDDSIQSEKCIIGNRVWNAYNSVLQWAPDMPAYAPTIPLIYLLWSCRGPMTTHLNDHFVMSLYWNDIALHPMNQCAGRKHWAPEESQYLLSTRVLSLSTH